MRSFKGFIRTDCLGSECQFEFEVEDDATEEQIQAEAREWAFNYVEWGYREVTNDYVAKVRQGGE